MNIAMVNCTSRHFVWEIDMTNCTLRHLAGQYSKFVRNTINIHLPHILNPIPLSNSPPFPIFSFHRLLLRLPNVTKMTEVVIKDLETGLRDLFRKSYLSNCEIECEELTEADRSTLEDLDCLEILENFKDLVNSLLSCKRDFKQTDKSDIVSRCEQFETMLQKLEAEVRTHIRVLTT